MKKRCQVSLEYMLIIGFAILMAIPMVVIYYNYNQDASDSVAAGQAFDIARKIVDSSESVFYLGKPSQTTMKLNFPRNLVAANFSEKEVAFSLKTKSGLTDIVQISSVNISGNISLTPGIHVITIRAEDNFVLVTSN